MKTNTVKGTRHLQWESDVAIKTGPHAWRVILRWAMLSLWAVFFLAGQNATAAILTLSVSNVFSIDQTINIGYRCEKEGWESRVSGQWSVSGDVTGNAPSDSFDFNYKPEDWKVKTTALDSFAAPGRSYDVNASCTYHPGTLTLYNSSIYATETFSVLPLTGTASAVVKNGKIVVGGTVGNGANRVVVYMDGNQVAEQSGLTSDYSIEVDAPVGTHGLQVYAYYYDQHYRLLQLIGGDAVTVHAPPTIVMDEIGKYTKTPNITISATAKSKAKIKSIWYEWQEPAGTGGGGSGDILGPPAEIRSADQQIAMNVDGTHLFRFTTQAEDEQYANSPLKSTILDRVSPTFKNQTIVEDGFLSADTVLRVEVSDLDPRGGRDSAGVKSVQMRAADKNGKTYGWFILRKNGGSAYKAEYVFALKEIFSQLPDGDVTISIWADDNADNSAYAPSIVYKKAEQPVASVNPPSLPTKEASIDLAIKVDAEVDVRKIWLNSWKIGKDKQRSEMERVELPFTKNKNVAFNHPFTFPLGDGKYFFSVITETVDGQQNNMAKQEPAHAIFDTTAPVVELLSPFGDGKHKTTLDVQFKVEDKDGSGVEDVQLQICKKGEDCNKWIEDIANDGLGVYTQELSLDDLESGAFTLWVWAKDKAGNRTWKYFNFEKELNADDAVTSSLSFTTLDGSAVTDPFYPDAERKLRIAVTPKVKLQGVNIAYALPAGLSLAGAPVLTGAGGLPDAEKQVAQWSGSGKLIADVDMEKDAGIVIEIPVKMTLALPTPKVRGTEQTTAFEMTGKSFIGTATAKAVWRADWKQEPADARSDIAQSFDLSSPFDIALFPRQSGGYDTAEPAKWNRNTLHCTGNAVCVGQATGTAIKLRFTEETTGQSVELSLHGVRHQTLSSGGAAVTTALDVAANAGADAEARFSIVLPKSELARLPSGGRWQASLAMDLRDAAGKSLAAFSSALTLDVGDKNGLALKPPQIELLQGSHLDNDGSGGFSAGDEVIYRITYEAARDLQGIQLAYDLPPELERISSKPLQKGASDTANVDVGDRLETMLTAGQSIGKGKLIVIDVPLRIRGGTTLHAISKVSARADGFDAMQSIPVRLNLQRRFAVSQALAMTLELDGESTATAIATDAVATSPPKPLRKQTPLIYRVVLTSQLQTLDKLSLAYRLPGGLQANGKPKLTSVGSKALVGVNAHWNGDTDIELLSADAALQKAESITIEIPVMIKEVVEDGVSVQSTVIAGAANLTGSLQKSHRIRTLERVARGDRVRIVKSMDGDASAVMQPGALIEYKIRVSNHTAKTVRNLLIRDRAPDHTTLEDASCGDSAAGACRVLKLDDSAVAGGEMTYAGLCAGAGPQSDPQGQHVFWCLSGDLQPLADTTVGYSVRIDSAAPVAAPGLSRADD